MLRSTRLLVTSLPASTEHVQSTVSTRLHVCLRVPLYLGRYSMLNEACCSATTFVILSSRNSVHRSRPGTHRVWGKSIIELSFRRVSLPELPISALVPYRRKGKNSTFNVSPFLARVPTCCPQVQVLMYCTDVHKLKLKHRGDKNTSEMEKRENNMCRIGDDRFC